MTGQIVRGNLSRAVIVASSDQALAHAVVRLRQATRDLRVETLGDGPIEVLDVDSGFDPEALICRLVTEVPSAPTSALDLANSDGFSIMLS